MANNFLWEKLCSTENLLLAFKKARKGKTTKEYVMEFEENIEQKLQDLQTELLLHSYRPELLKTFILRDPKTRKISKSAFRDRIIHHALCNIIEPLFEKRFIFDSYANRRGKGTLKAVQRFEYLSRKISKNNSLRAFVLKADIYHYFETVDHAILLPILQRRIGDKKILWLVETIVKNYYTEKGKGMPLGNLTSQFFANVFLHELDFFVKQHLGVQYYVRYVDDFVLFNKKREILECWMKEIDLFLKEKLHLQLHPQKSRIIPLSRGVDFLGFKIFPCHKLIVKKNKRTFFKKFSAFCEAYEKKEIAYDKIYDFLEGWLAYARQANTYRLRQQILLEVEKRFKQEISSKEVNRYRYLSFPLKKSI